MVRPAKSSTKCTIDMAKDRAGPRFSIFRAKKMKGWWPLTRQKTLEDFEREEKEKEEAKKKGNKKKKKKSKDKRSKMRPEDIQYTDSSGNTFLLMVRRNPKPGSSEVILQSAEPLPFFVGFYSFSLYTGSEDFNGQKFVTCFYLLVLIPSWIYSTQTKRVNMRILVLI